MSRSGNFLIIITSIVKLIGIAKATIFPNKVPWLIESPTITNMPTKAKVIADNPFKVIYSFRNKNKKTSAT